MRKYLIDTGVLTAYLTARPRIVSLIVSLIEPYILNNEAATSILIYGEIDEYHRAKPDYQQRKQVLLSLLNQILPLTPNIAIMERYAAIRRSLRPPHGPGLIGDIDTVIAATALEHNLTMITADSDFARVSGLKLLQVDRSWLKS